MELKLNRDLFLKSLSHIQGIVEKKNTIPILSNVLLDARNEKITLSATDLDIIIIETIPGEVIQEGSTTTTAQVIYDLVRKLPAGSEILISLKSEGQLSLISAKSNFNLKCLSTKDFPVTQDDLNVEGFSINSNVLLKLLNKTKFAISNDETRHYLNGIYLHKAIEDNKNYLVAVATDGHRLSKSRVPLESDINFEPVILPRKTLFELVTILQEENSEVKISSTKSKIKFLISKIVLISKVIDGRYPDYSKVIPTDNDNKINVNLSQFISTIDRINSLSSDRKGTLKLVANRDILKFLVNDPTAGDGVEEIAIKYQGADLEIGFNSKYLIDVGSVIDDKDLVLNAKNPSSPVLIFDPSDINTLHVIMPMRVA